MLDSDRLATFIRDLRAASPAEKAQAVLWEGAELVENARLVGNQAALYRLAAALLDAAQHPGRPVDATDVFSEQTSYYLAEVVAQEEGVSTLLEPTPRPSRTGDWIVGIGCLTVVVLAIVGLVAIVGWLF